MTQSDPDNPPNTTMSLSDHLLELRTRLLYCVGFLIVAFAVLFPYADVCLGYLVTPLADLLQSSHTDRRLIYTGLPEAFLTNIKVTLFFAFTCSVPWFSYHLSRFVIPGLYKKEKSIFLSFVIAAPALFIFGALFSFYVVIPKAWAFFLSYETSGVMTGLPIQLEARISEYLSMTLQLMMSFGLCFQLPLILVILSQLNIIQTKTLTSKRRYAFIFILIAAAMLTPPDVFSMMALALPIYALYELSIVVVRFTNHQK